MGSLAPPAGRGWEYLLGEGWDWDGELARIPEYLAERVKAPTVEAGVYDLVIDPTNLWLTIHESIGHATELDRAMGYEAAYAGTSFATFDKLGTFALRLGDHERDRRPHGRPRPGDGRVRRRGGRGAGLRPRPRRPSRRLPARPAHRSFEGARPVQRLRLRRLPSPCPSSGWRMCRCARRPGTGPTKEELIASVEEGFYIVGDKSWSIDMQRYNFQFTGQRFFRIDKGRLAGQVRDVAVPVAHDRILGSHAGRRRRVHLPSRRGVQLRQGPARSGRARQPRLPLGSLPGHQRAEHPSGVGSMSAADVRLIPAHTVVERPSRPRGPTVA